MVSGLVAVLQIVGINMKDPLSLTVFNHTSMIYVMAMGSILLKETIHVGR